MFLGVLGALGQRFPSVLGVLGVGESGDYNTINSLPPHLGS